MGGSIKVKKECMNNCKVANMLTVNKGLAEKQMIRVSTLPSRKIVTLVNLCAICAARRPLVRLPAATRRSPTATFIKVFR